MQHSRTLAHAAFHSPTVARVFDSSLQTASLRLGRGGGTPMCRDAAAGFQAVCDRPRDDPDAPRRGGKHLARGDLASDEVVYLEDGGRAGHHDALCRQDRHQPLPERIQLRLRVPNLADLEIAVGPETDVVIKSVRMGSRPGPASRLSIQSSTSATTGPCGRLMRVSSGSVSSAWTSCTSMTPTSTSTRVESSASWIGGGAGAPVR